MTVNRTDNYCWSMRTTLDRAGGSSFNDARFSNEAGRSVSSSSMTPTQVDEYTRL